MKQCTSILLVSIILVVSASVNAVSSLDASGKLGKQNADYAMQHFEEWSKVDQHIIQKKF